MDQETKERVYKLLPWALLIAVLTAVTLFGLYYKVSPTPFETELTKINLLSTMRIHLLEAIEAEKNAVLAITDEASEAFAAQARQASDNVEVSREEMGSIIQQHKLPRETELIEKFNACWLQFRQLDDTILNLAIQNTNLKAQQLSSTQVAREIARFEERLNRLMLRNSNDGHRNEIVTRAYEALTASLKIFALQKTHIEELEDLEMDKLEQNIKSYDESARKALGALRTIDGLGDNEDLKNAEGSYDQFMSLTAEVLKLSRMNSNLTSAAQTMGKQRLISAQCQADLANLQETVQAERFKSTK
jgi:hypothetical protein